MKALTQEQVELVSLQRFPLSRSGARSRRGCNLPGRPRAVGIRPRLPRRGGGREVALARLCALALVQRPGPPSAHPRRVEDVIGPNILVWTSTFFIKEPNSPLMPPGIRTAGILAWNLANRSVLGGGRVSRSRVHGATIVPRKAAAYHHRRWAWPTASNRAGQTIMEPFDDREPWRWRCPQALFATPRACRAPLRPQPREPSPRGIGLNYIPNSVRVNGPRVTALY